MGIPRESHANPACNVDEEGVRQITEARVEEAEAVLAYATATLITSPKDLDHLQKTRAYSGAAVRGSIVLAANRANNKWTGEAYCG
jgi:hypothetical protein